MLLGENIKNSVKRIMKEKFKINSTFKKINSISLEHVKKNKKIIHSFLLILVTATTKEKPLLTNTKENKSKIIKSDYKLITNNLNKEIDIETIMSHS